MKWRILVAINVALLVLGFLLAWAWERGAVWGRPSGEASGAIMDLSK